MIKMLTIFLLCIISVACDRSESNGTSGSPQDNVPLIKQTFMVTKNTSVSTISITSLDDKKELYVIENGDAQNAWYIVLNEPEAVHINSMMIEIDPVNDADTIIDPIQTDRQIILNVPKNNIFYKYIDGYASDGKFHKPSVDVQVFTDYILYLHSTKQIPKANG
jgi:hypothetical protein